MVTALVWEHHAATVDDPDEMLGALPGDPLGEPEYWYARVGTPWCNYEIEMAPPAGTLGVGGEPIAITDHPDGEPWRLMWYENGWDGGNEHGGITWHESREAAMVAAQTHHNNGKETP